MLLLKLSRSEQHAVIAFFVGKKDLMQIRFTLEMHPVYGNKCFTKWTVQLWGKKMLGGKKFASDTKVQSVVHQWLREQLASFFASGIQKLVDRWERCLN